MFYCFQEFKIPFHKNLFLKIVLLWDFHTAFSYNSCLIHRFMSHHLKEWLRWFSYCNLWLLRSFSLRYQKIFFFYGSIIMEGVLKFSEVVSILNYWFSHSSESDSFESICFHQARYIVGSPSPRNFSCSKRGFGRPLIIHSWQRASSG